MRYPASTLSALGMLLLSGTGIAAQALPVTLELTPAAGGIIFAGELPATFQLTAETGEALVLEGVELDDALAAGGRAAARFGDQLAIGATLLYAPLSYRLDGAERDGALFSYGADLSWHAIAASLVSPFLIAGLGAKTYDFDGASAETDFMWNAGAGLDLALGRRTALRLEARDYMSLFSAGSGDLDDELQHDLALSAGLRLTLPFGPRDASGSAMEGGGAIR